MQEKNDQKKVDQKSYLYSRKHTLAKVPGSTKPSSDHSFAMGRVNTT